jgi:PadR family transcriptional regulator, regulatory protein PadR
MSDSDPSELFENWTIQMRKGVLDFCILKALAGGECYGYALVKALVAIPGIGVAEGSIYPLLSRLKKQGLVSTRLEESSEGPARKYYRLTSSGRLVGEEMQAYFADMAKGVAGLGGRVDFTGVPTKEPTGQAGSGRGRVQPDKLP